MSASGWAGVQKPVAMSKSALSSLARIVGRAKPSIFTLIPPSARFACPDEGRCADPLRVAGLGEQLAPAGHIARILVDRLVVARHALGDGAAHLHRPAQLDAPDDARVVDGVGAGLADLRIRQVPVLVVTVHT